MANDRFVYFENRKPTRSEIQKILENYLGGCGKITENPENYWILDLPGNRTQALAGVKGASSYLSKEESTEEPERWIEIVFNPIGASDEGPNIDVITRLQDEFTNGLAIQLTHIFERFYRGRLSL